MVLFLKLFCLIALKPGLVLRSIAEIRGKDYGRRYTIVLRKGGVNLYLISSVYIPGEENNFRESI